MLTEKFNRLDNLTKISRADQCTTPAAPPAMDVLCPGDFRHYWFGYYDVCPWSADRKTLVCQRTGFMDRPPEPEDRAEIVRFDVGGLSHCEPVAETFAWNWQMGCRLQWMADTAGNTLYYNDRRENRFVCIRKNLATGGEDILENPIYAVSRDGSRAATLNFSRLHDCRPGYGYPGIPDPGRNDPAPANDGLFVMDMRTGKKDLIVSLKQLAGFQPGPDIPSRKQWINHLFWSPDDSRIVFLHRWDENGVRITRMMTVNPDGSGLACLGKSPLISHFDWQYRDRILVWAQLGGYPPYLYDVEDPSGKINLHKSGIFHGDGHCSWSPDREWILTDTYPSPDRKIYRVLLYHPGRGELHTVATLQHPLKYQVDCRCDLHPRWSRDGLQVCFDTVLNGTRKVCIADVGNIVRQPENPDTER